MIFNVETNISIHRQFRVSVVVSLFFPPHHCWWGADEVHSRAGDVQKGADVVIIWSLQQQEGDDATERNVGKDAPYSYKRFFFGRREKKEKVPLDVAQPQVHFSFSSFSYNILYSNVS